MKTNQNSHKKISALHMEVIINYAPFVDPQEFFNFECEIEGATFDEIMFTMLLAIVEYHSENEWNAGAITSISTWANWSEWEKLNNTKLPDYFNNGKFAFNRQYCIYDAISWYEQHLKAA